MPAWIAVASANHVAIGRRDGFMQVNHGKAAPLRRIAPGDMVAYYSPTAVFGTKTPLQAFTAMGRVREGAVYLGQMPGDFTPWRRDVAWWEATPAPIAPLLGQLELTVGKVNWGYPFRFGLLPVADGDIALIATAMRAVEPTRACRVQSDLHIHFDPQGSDCSCKRVRGPK